MQPILDFFNSPLAAQIFLCLFVISEGLAQIDFIKSNSIYQVIVQILTFVKGMFVKPQA